TTLSSGGFIHIHSGALVNSTTVISGCSLNLLYGGKASNTVALGSAVIKTSWGFCFLNSTTLSSGGYLHLSSGGTAYNTTVHVGARFKVSSGGTAVYTTTYGEGVFDPLSGAVVLNTTVSGGSFSIGSECSATSTTVESGALLHIYSGSANVNIIKSGGSAVNRFGTMNSTTVKAGGVLDLWGGSATDIIEDGGYVKFSSGVYMTYASNTFSGVKLGNAQSATVHSVTTANGTTVGSGGLLEVDGGRLNNTTVSSGGSVVFMGGVADGTVLNAGALFDLHMLYRPAVMSNTTIHSGVSLAVIDSQVQFDGVTVNSGGSLSIISGGTVTRIVENGGHVYLYDVWATFVSNTFSGVKLGSGKSATVHSATTANGTVISNGGQMEVYSGTLNNTVISSGGRLYFIDGRAYDTVLSKGAVVKIYYGQLIRTTINSGASVEIDEGIVMDSTTVNSMGSMAVSSGGVASRTILSGGKLEVYAGGSAVGGIVGSNGGMHVYGGGVASNMSVASRGLFYVSAGGSADGIAVSSGGTLSIRSGGTADNTTLSGGLLALSGGRAGFAIVEAGMVNVSSGGRAEGLSVSSGGTVQVYRGGIVNGLDSYSGSLYVSAGGRATGRMYFLGDSVVSFDDGSMLNFDISIFSPGGTTACVNDLSFVTGTPDYTLTVGAGQEEGEYKLANNAAGFNRTVTVKDAEGTSLGTLKVGQTAKLGGVDYTLNLTNDALSVTVGAAVVTGMAKGDIDGNGISDVMFIWTGNNYAHGYWMNGTSEWQSANSNHPAEWDNLGCYDMTGDGKADSVLFGNVTSEAGIHGAYIGYYADAIDNPDGSTWVNIGYLNNVDNIDWKNKVGNLTGNASGVNSIVWYAPELYALGVWTDGTENWITLSNDFGGDAWTLIGCGDFNGDGKAQVVMALNGGEVYYTVGIDGTSSELTKSDSGWEVRAIGDFAGDEKDDIVAFHKETGLVAMWGDGESTKWAQLGQLDASDWFIAGCGDYNGDQKDDLLVRQYSTGMLGYYSSGDTAQWNVLGYGVDMSWTVIA
ncbi:MAG: AIDA repeat-containing protein, partial [Lentisphaeria bacterium]|nr:AIDA repeat-containing protein [Lentisphaeria bacterium]